MVAYSFRWFFEPQIVDLTKLQTIRNPRKRHARPGEAVQLYREQRTRNCHKMLDPDPLCRYVREIRIELSDLLPELIASIAIDGFPLHRDEIEGFCRDDGFAPERIGKLVPELDAPTARENMGRFWRLNHGLGAFEGVLIRWEPLA